MTANGMGKWLLPSWLALQGVLILAAKWVGGDVREGVLWLVAALGAAVLFLAAGRSEVARIASVLLLGVFGAFLYEASQGRSGAGYGWLLVLATATYLGSLTVLNRRS